MDTLALGDDLKNIDRADSISAFNSCVFQRLIRGAWLSSLNHVKFFNMGGCGIISWSLLEIFYCLASVSLRLHAEGTCVSDPRRTHFQLRLKCHNIPINSNMRGGRFLQDLTPSWDQKMILNQVRLSNKHSVWKIGEQLIFHFHVLSILNM